MLPLVWDSLSAGYLFEAELIVVFSKVVGRLLTGSCCGGWRILEREFTLDAAIMASDILLAASILSIFEP